MKKTPLATVQAPGIFHALLVFVLVLAVGGFVEYAKADIYKCTDENGSLIFSQKPCGADAEAVVIENHTAGVSFVGDGDFSSVDADNRTREIGRAIDRRYQHIDDLQAQRDAKLANLRQQQNAANNNLAGATYRQSIATEMQAISEDYNARIAAERSAIQDLNSQR